jgi:hypothetical protein
MFPLWKRRPRFGLRTLLLGITAVCLLLTAIPYEARQYHQRKTRTRNLITSLGGSIDGFGYLQDPSPGSNWLSERLGYVEPRESLWKVSLSWASLSSSDIQQLARCDWIWVLDLSNTRIGDDALEHVAGLSNLLELRLRHTQVTDAGIRRLKSLRRLAVLDVVGTAVTYDSLAELEETIGRANFQEQLAISRARSSGIVVDLGTPMLPMTNRASPQATLNAILQQIENWGEDVKPDAAASVELSHTVELTPAQVEDLRRLASAHSFDAIGVIFPKEGLSFLSDLSNLQSVSIDDAGIGNLSDDDLEWLAKLPNLKALELYSERITDRGIAHLAKAPQLVALALSGNRLTAAGVKHLANAPRLQSLSLRGDGLTIDVLGYLRGLAWLEVLQLDLSCHDPVGTKFAAPSADAIAAARDAMEHVGEIPNLRQLSVGGSLMVAEVLEPLTELSSLVRLKIDERFVSHAGARHLQEEMPHCHVQRTRWIR